jgi:RNA polymerase sigma factor (sigma-70 family)
MNTMDDWQLLRDYATRNSEEAFRALVDRYAGLVYHATLRQTGNPHVAEEVTQAVFIALAQKADRIPRGAILSGWLFRATRFAFSNLAREQSRRRRREQEAVMMENMLRPDDTASVWEQIVPHLNDALDRLPRKDREAVLVRFFQGRSHRELARTLGVSEDAAKVRVSRAVEKLRLILARRGFAVPTAVLLATISAHGAQAAPAGLTASVASAAVAKGIAGTTSTLTIAKGVLKLMAWTKAKTAVAVSLAVILAVSTTTTLVVQHRHRIVPRSSWAFAGYANPESAFQSSVWALSKGNAQTWLASLTPAMQVEVRQRATGNDDNIISEEDKRDFARITGYRILHRQVVSQDEVVLEVYAEGLKQTTKASIQRMDGEWKFGGKEKRKSSRLTP